MKFSIRSFVFFCVLFASKFAFGQPSNDECGSAVTVTSYATTCGSATAGTVSSATSSLIAANVSCGGAPDDDVWYKFVAQSNSTTIELSGITNGNNKFGNATPTLEL